MSLLETTVLGSHLAIATKILPCVGVGTKDVLKIPRIVGGLGDIGILRQLL